jgi:RNA polymerase sigma-70 factor, ECF subfamily
VDALSDAGMEANASDVESDARAETERIFRKHYASLTRVIARTIGDRERAEELAVEVCLKWSAAARRTPGEDGERWLYRAAVQTGLNEVRQRMRRSRYERLVSLVRGPAAQTPEDLAASHQEQQRVRGVLAAMDRRKAELLLLRGEGHSYEELAQALDLNPASVGTLLSRAQTAFRKEYTRRYGTGQLESK